MSRLQFRSPAEERAHWRSEIQALQQERDELAASLVESRRDAERLAAAAEKAADAARLEGEVEELRRLSDSSKDSLARYEVSERNAAAETAIARAEAATLAKDLAAARTALSEAELRNAARCADLRRVGEDAEALRVAASAEATEQRSIARAAEDAQRLAEATVQELRSEAEQLRARQREVSARAARCMELEIEVARLQEALSNSVASGKEACRTADAQVRDAEQRLGESERRADDAERRLKEFESSERASREHHDREMAEAISRITKENEKAAAAAEECVQIERNRVSALEKHRDELLDQVAAASTAVLWAAECEKRAEEADRRASVEAQRALAASQSAAVETARAARCSDDATMAQARAEESRCACEKATADLQKIRVEMAELRSNCNRLESENAQVREFSIDALSKVTTENNARTQAEDEVRRLKGEIAKRDMEIEAQRLAHYDLQRETSYMRESFEKQASEIEHLQTKFVVRMGTNELMEHFGGSAGRAVAAAGQPLVGSVTPRGTVAGSGHTAAAASRAASSGRTARYGKSSSSAVAAAGTAAGDENNDACFPDRSQNSTSGKTVKTGGCPSRPPPRRASNSRPSGQRATSLVTKPPSETPSLPDNDQDRSRTVPRRPPSKPRPRTPSTAAASDDAEGWPDCGVSSV